MTEKIFRLTHIIHDVITKIICIHLLLHVETPGAIFMSFTIFYFPLLTQMKNRLLNLFQSTFHSLNVCDSKDGHCAIAQAQQILWFSSVCRSVSPWPTENVENHFLLQENEENITRVLLILRFKPYKVVVGYLSDISKLSPILPRVKHRLHKRRRWEKAELKKSKSEVCFCTQARHGLRQWPMVFNFYFSKGVNADW